MPALVEFLEERQVHLVPFLETGALFVVTDAGINEDAMAFGLNQQRMDAEEDVALFVEEGR